MPGREEDVEEVELLEVVEEDVKADGLVDKMPLIPPIPLLLIILDMELVILELELDSSPLTGFCNLRL